MLTNKKFLISFLFLLNWPAVSMAGDKSPFILVSDVDDTVKVTHVHHLCAIWRALASKLVFAGMPELYQGLLGDDSPGERLEFLSGSPSFLRGKVSNLLKEAKFPPYTLTLKGWRECTSSACKYKTEQLHGVHGASQETFLLIGDDTESDPEVYANFSAQRPIGQVLRTYIRRVTGRPLPPGSIAFVTAYDIALQEKLAGRMDENQAALVGNAVLAAKRSAFLPRFQQCPREYVQISGLPENLNKLKQDIEHRMTDLCSKRHPIPATRRKPRLCR